MHINQSKITTDIENEHAFFSNLGDGREYFKGLLEESFVPQNISDPEDKTFEESTESIAECAREYIIPKPNRKKGTKKKDISDIIVFDGGTQKKQTILKRSDIMDMYQGDEWLSTKLIDAYLSNLVVPDLHRYQDTTRFKCHYVDMSVMKFTLEENYFTLGYTVKFEKLLKNKLGNPNDYDVIFFGGTDDLSHFFLLALMPESNKIFYL